MKLTNVQIVSRSGSALMVVIPKKITKAQDYEAGDLISVDWGEVIKKNQSNPKKEKKEIKLPEI